MLFVSLIVFRVVIRHDKRVGGERSTKSGVCETGAGEQKKTIARMNDRS